MKPLSAHHCFYSSSALAVLVGSMLAVTGCKPPTLPPAPELPTPRSTPTRQADSEPANDSAKISTSHAPAARMQSTPASEQPPVVVHAPKVAPTPDIPHLLALEQEYNTTQDIDRKTEIIFELGDEESDFGWQSLSRLVVTEKNPDLKSQLITALGDSDMPDAQKVGFLGQYVGPEQNEDVRYMAVEALDDIDDPRAMAVWQRLLNDKDESIRDTATAAIERLRSPDNK